METPLQLHVVNVQLHASRMPRNPWELTQDQIHPEGHLEAGVSWKLGPDPEGLLPGEGRRSGACGGHWWSPFIKLGYLGRGYKTTGEQSVLFKY